jgi:5,10-methylenetetrahydromethanopterin reductase
MVLVFEAEITPIIGTREIIKLAGLAEEIGVDRLGISDVIFHRDTFELQALCAYVTQRLKIGSLVTNPYTRHPVVIASAASTLDEISQGRAFVGLGAGAGIRELGVTQSPPASALREAVGIIKELLAGRAVKYQGNIYRLSYNNNAKLESPPQHKVPILIGTRSPKIAKLAGEVADIVVIGGRYVSEQQLKKYLSWISEGAANAGRDMQAVEVAPRLTLCASRDGELAKQSVKLYAAYYLTLLQPPDLLIDEGKLNRIVDAVRRVEGWYFSPNVQYPEEIDKLVDDEILEKFAVAGTIDECIPKIRDIVSRFNFRSISLNIAAVRRKGTCEGMIETITSLGEIIRALQRS